jgi:hypothetical protein
MQEKILTWLVTCFILLFVRDWSDVVLGHKVELKVERLCLCEAISQKRAMLALLFDSSENKTTKVKNYFECNFTWNMKNVKM